MVIGTLIVKPFTILPVCSNRPRPSVHSNRSPFGSQHWAKDVFHAFGDNGKTMCGVKIDGWLRLDPMPVADAKADRNFCSRCLNKLFH